jgi:hypothetical protein
MKPRHAAALAFLFSLLGTWAVMYVLVGPAVFRIGWLFSFGIVVLPWIAGFALRYFLRRSAHRAAQNTTPRPST